MQNTTNYNLKIVQGSDIVNPLVIDNPNYETIDTAMFENKNSGVQMATEILSGSVHVLTRTVAGANTFKFVATSDFTSGETFTVDGVQVTAYTTNSQPLQTNAFRIGTTVLCSLHNTVLTMFVSGMTGSTVAEDSEKLGGELPNYYAKQGDMSNVQENQTNMSQAILNKVSKSGDTMNGALVGSEAVDTIAQFRNFVVYPSGTVVDSLNVPNGTIICILK